MSRYGGVFQSATQEDTVPLELFGKDGVQEGVGAAVQREDEDGQNLGERRNVSLVERDRERGKEREREREREREGGEREGERGRDRERRKRERKSKRESE